MPISRTMRGVIVLLLLIVGLELTQLLGHAYWPISHSAKLVLLIALTAACIPPLARAIARGLEHLRHPSARAATIASVAIALLSVVSVSLKHKPARQDVSF